MENYKNKNQQKPSSSVQYVRKNDLQSQQSSDHQGERISYEKKQNSQINNNQNQYQQYQIQQSQQYSQKNENRQQINQKTVWVIKTDQQVMNSNEFNGQRDNNDLKNVQNQVINKANVSFNPFQKLEEQIYQKMKQEKNLNMAIVKEEMRKQQEQNGMIQKPKKRQEINKNNQLNQPILQNNNQLNQQPQVQDNQQDKQKNLNEKKQENNKRDKFRRNEKHKQIEQGFENALWKCKACKAMNLWKHDKVCMQCGQQKYRLYDRMRKDFGQQDYQFIFFIDFECNSLNGQFEIIEFPLHVIDASTKEIIESFVSYVKPSSNITKFITKLTRITNDHVKDAPILQQVLVNVENFLQKYLDAGIDKCVVVYDNDSDSKFLSDETKKKKIKLPTIFEKYICLKSVFPIEIENEAPASLAQMLKQLNMQFEGQEHCGADDAMNQARVGQKLLQLGYNFSKRQEVKLGQPSLQIPNQLQNLQYNQYKQEYLLSLQQKEQKANEINFDEFIPLKENLIISK